MTRRDRLREQAEILRNLASSFDIPTIREELLALAKKCEALAEAAAGAISEEAQKQSW